MKTVDRKQSLVRLSQGMQADFVDYRALRELLKAQFQAAVGHRSAQLAQLADQITALCATLEARRVERVALVSLWNPLVGERAPAERVPMVLGELPEGFRQPALALWQALEAIVLECKALNQRNCSVLLDQHEVMQRVLGNGDEIYAPV